MIKVGFVIDTILSPTAGTEKQLLLLIEHLDRARFQPVLIALRSSPWLELEFDLCPLYVAQVDSFKSLKGWRGVWRLGRYLRRERVRIVQTHFRDSSIAGTLAARLARVEAVVASRRNQGYWMTWLELQIQRALDRWTCIYVANSLSTKRWVIDNEGVPPGRVTVVNNGFDLASLPQDPRQAREQSRPALGLASDAPVVVIVANLRPVKDHVTFLRAAQVVLRSKPACRFLVVGDGEERPRLEALAAELGLTHAVSFLGPRRDVPRLLALSDIGVLSSLSESFSNALVEYLVSGLPVVATDVGGAREAIDDGVNGYVVPVGDSAAFGKRVLEILNSGRASQMGRESQRRGRELFSLKNMVHNFEELYSSCPKGTP